MSEVSFSGNFAHNIDPKGRVTIPVSFREALGKGFTIGLNNQSTALALYPRDIWAKKCAQLQRIPESDVKGMYVRRWIMGNSFSDSDLDAQGRILLPTTLRQLVHMDKAIRFVGMDSYLEIWDEQRYLDENARIMASYEELLSYVDNRYFSGHDDT